MQALSELGAAVSINGGSRPRKQKRFEPLNDGTAWHCNSARLALHTLHCSLKESKARFLLESKSESSNLDQGSVRHCNGASGAAHSTSRP